MKSMKKFVAALLVLMMVVALASTAFAYNEKPEDKYVQFKGSAWGYGKVTNQYGKNRSSVCLRKGSIAHVVAVKGKWYKIEVPKRHKLDENETFWFHKKYTKSTTIDTPYLVYSSGGSGRSESQGNGMVDALKGMKVKLTGKVNLRKTASLKGKSQGTVKKGKKVTLTGNAGTDDRNMPFFEVKYGSKKGYISGAYVSDSDLVKILKALDSEAQE